MPQSFRVLAAALVLLSLLAADVRGQTLLEIDGIELRGEAQLVMSGGGTCNVLESDTSYEAKKENHGAPMDIWRLDFSVRNGSGRWLDHLIAMFGIESEWPECTNWDGPDAGTFEQSIEWANSNGVIQESGRNVVSPGQTLTATRLFIVLRGDPEPRFSNWSMNFDFAAAPPPPGAGSLAEAPNGSAELDGLFWQSIVNSTNPADFEAYLAQFPNGVFRALAENRLAALRAPTSGLRSSGDRTPSLPPNASVNSASRVAAAETCTAKPSGTACWMELTNRPGCYVWNPNPQPGETVTWTAECADGLADASGSLTWVSDGNTQYGTPSRRPMARTRSHSRRGRERVRGFLCLRRAERPLDLPLRRRGSR